MKDSSPCAYLSCFWCWFLGPFNELDKKEKKKLIFILGWRYFGTLKNACVGDALLHVHGIFH